MIVNFAFPKESSKNKKNIYFQYWCYLDQSNYIYSKKNILNENNQNLSPNQKAFLRLKRNKPAVLGFFVIVISVFIAIFGYWLAPDNTPNANNQMIEIPLKNPGFSTKVLQYRKNTTIPNQNMFYTLLFGKTSPYKTIPISEYNFLGDSIFIKKYSEDEFATPEWKSYHIADVAFALSVQGQNIQRSDDEISFIDNENKTHQSTITELQKQIESNQIYTEKFYLGTDQFGRDMLSRLILGVRISLLVGLIAVFISLTIGLTLGALAGYFGGRIDNIILFLINTAWSIPTLLLVFAIVLALGKSIVNIFFAVGLTMWVDVARVVRGQVMSLKTVQFVEAAKTMGFSTRKIIARHILPNILGPVMVITAANFATAILLEAGLSYLGFGIQPPTPSWGTMLNENYGYAIGGKPLLALIPALAILIMVLSFNLLGNGFRDALDVKE